MVGQKCKTINSADFMLNYITFHSRFRGVPGNISPGNHCASEIMGIVCVSGRATLLWALVAKASRAWVEGGLIISQ